MALARRCDHLLLDISQNDNEFLMKTLVEVAKNEYHPEKNPQGVIHLSGAENMISEEMINEKIGKGEIYLVDEPLHWLFSAPEMIRLRKATANFLTHFLQTAKPVSPENLFFGSGAAACLDSLVHCLADPGDCFLVVAPLFSRIPNILKDRCQVEVIFIHLSERSSDAESAFQLTMEKIENAFDKAKANGKTIKGFLLVNPGNPIGDVISLDLLQQILAFCHRNKLHVIADEVYALSVQDEQTQFRSVLSLPNLPNPDSTHFLYGMSKDFGLVKYRMGVVHTCNPALKRCLSQLRFFNFIPLPISTACCRILEDLDWCERFFKYCRHTMRKNRDYAGDRLESMGLLLRPTPASFYVWASFKKIFTAITFEEEDSLCRALFQEAKINLWGGRQYYCLDPGWFRFNIAVPTDYLKTALDRLEDFVTKLKKNEFL